MSDLHLSLLQFSLAVGVAFAALLVGHILRQRRHPAATIAWVLFVVTLPWLAVPAYLSFGTRKLRPRPTEHLPAVPVNAPASGLDRLLESAAAPPLRGGHRLHWHADGTAARRALLKLIESATTRLDIALFLLADDAAGHDFFTALEARAAAGVRVRLLIDGVGAFRLQRTVLARLRAAGITVTWFIPLLHRPFRARSNLRNHRKLAIADGARAWVGGRNVADEYFAAATVWVDLSLTLEGPAVGDLLRLYEHDWSFASRTQARPAEALPTAVGEAQVQLVAAGPDHARDLLHESLLTLLFSARRRIVLTTPYFVPDDAVQLALCLAARRGVAVSLLLPARSNHRLADIARGRYLRELIDAGVRVRLLPGAMLHAKAWLIDDDALAGSANLDLRSLFLNFELMLRLRGEPETAWLADWLGALDARSEDASAEPVGILRELLEGTVLLTAFQL